MSSAYEDSSDFRAKFGFLSEVTDELTAAYPKAKLSRKAVGQTEKGNTKFILTVTGPSGSELDKRLGLILQSKKGKKYAVLGKKTAGACEIDRWNGKEDDLSDLIYEEPTPVERSEE